MNYFYPRSRQSVGVYIVIFVVGVIVGMSAHKFGTEQTKVVDTKTDIQKVVDSNMVSLTRTKILPDGTKTIRTRVMSKEHVDERKTEVSHTIDINKSLNRMDTLITLSYFPKSLSDLGNGEYTLGVQKRMFGDFYFGGLITSEKRFGILGTIGY